MKLVFKWKWMTNAIYVIDITDSNGLVIPFLCQLVVSETEVSDGIAIIKIILKPKYNGQMLKLNGG